MLHWAAEISKDLDEGGQLHLVAPGTELFPEPPRPLSLQHDKKGTYSSEDDSDSQDDELHWEASALMKETDAAAALKTLLSAKLGELGWGTRGDAATNLLHQVGYKRQRTLLMQAARHNRPACVELLAKEFRVEVNQKTPPEAGSQTALHFAAFYGAAEAVLALLKAGADPTLANSADHDACSVANNLPIFATSIRRSSTHEGSGIDSTTGSNGGAASGTDLIRRHRLNPVLWEGIGEEIEGEPQGPAMASGTDLAGNNVANYAYSVSRKRRRGETGGGRGLPGAEAANEASSRLVLRRSLGLLHDPCYGPDPFVGSALELYIGQALAMGRDPFVAEGRGPAAQPTPGTQAPPQPRDPWQLQYYRRHDAAMQEHSQFYGAEAPTAAAAAPAVPQCSYKLKVKQSESVQPGTEWPLPFGSDVIIGRNHRVCNIVLKEIMISKTHARLVVSAQGAVVYDLNAKHGSVVNARKSGETGRIVTRYPVPVPTEGLVLNDGDELLLGSTLLVITKDQPPPSAEPPKTTSTATGSKSSGPQVISKGFQLNDRFIKALVHAQDTEGRRTVTKQPAVVSAQPVPSNRPAVLAAAASEPAPASPSRFEYAPVGMRLMQRMGWVEGSDTIPENAAVATATAAALRRPRQGLGAGSPSQGLGADADSSTPQGPSAWWNQQRRFGPGSRGPTASVATALMPTPSRVQFAMPAHTRVARSRASPAFVPSSTTAEPDVVMQGMERQEGSDPVPENTAVATAAAMRRPRQRPGAELPRQGLGVEPDASTPQDGSGMWLNQQRGSGWGSLGPTASFATGSPSPAASQFQHAMPPRTRGTRSRPSSARVPRTSSPSAPVFMEMLQRMAQQEGADSARESPAEVATTGAAAAGGQGAEAEPDTSRPPAGRNSSTWWQ